MILDIFNGDAFSEVELTAAINKTDYLPGLIGSLNIFEPIPVSTTTVAIEQVGDVLALVPNTQRGGPAQALNDTGSARRRTLRDFRTTHLPVESRLVADEIQNIRAFGSQTETEMAQQKVLDRLVMARRNIELTWENLMFGAVKGAIYDADGTTVIYNLFTEFGVSQVASIDFDLDNASPASGAVRTKCQTTVRSILTNLKGNQNVPGLQIIALCGDTFFDQLVAHAEVRATYLNQVEARELRGGMAFGEVSYGGIRFINYRGTDDGTTLAVTTGTARIFPVGVPGLFKMHYAPADTIAWANTPGLPFYAQLALDTQFDRFIDLRVQSNPLPICTQPKVLHVATNT